MRGNKKRFRYFFIFQNMENNYKYGTALWRIGVPSSRSLLVAFDSPNPRFEKNADRDTYTLEQVLSNS